MAASNCRRRVSGYDVTNPGVRVFEEIEADEVGRMRSTRLGDATLQECEVGPLTVPDHQLAVDHGASGQVRSSREARYYSQWHVAIIDPSGSARQVSYGSLLGEAVPLAEGKGDLLRSHEDRSNGSYRAKQSSLLSQGRKSE